MSLQKLTPGQLHWLLDPDVSRGTAFGAPHDSFPDRLEKLNELSDDNVRKLITEIDQDTALPTPLLADYDTVTLLSRTRIPPNVKLYMKDFIETLIRDIQVRTNLRFQLPVPLFDNDARFRSETLVPRHRVDMSTIAYDRNNNNDMTRLTLVQDADAFSTLKQTGVYKRGDFDIRFSWYPGRNKIKGWRNVAWAESLYQWTVQFPSIIAGREQSVLLGMWQFVSGVGITGNRLTGLIPTNFPKYTSSEIESECTKEYFQWLQDAQGFTLTATQASHVGTSLHNRRSYRTHTAQTVRYPVIFVHPKRGRLDFRTSVPPTRTRLDRILNQVRQAVETKMGPQRMTIIRSLSQASTEEEAIERYLEMWHQAYLEAVEERRSAIDNLSSFPDLTATVLKEERARILVARIVKAKLAERESMIERDMNAWKESHPLKAASGKFEARQLSTVTMRVNEAVPLYDGIQDALLEADLDDLVLLVETQDEFERSEVLAERKKTLNAARKPGVVEIMFLRLPSRWTVERRQFNGDTFYELEFYRKVKVLSSLPLWRLRALGIRYFSWIWNSSFYLANKASVALRRWNIFRKSFDIRLPSVHPTTGEFDKTPVRTLRGRLESLLEWKQRIVQKAREGEHIIRLREGLYLDTCWAHFWTTVSSGLGSASILCYTVAETILVVAGASIALVTSPVWSLLGNVGRSLNNALLYDCELNTGENSKSPLLRNFFGLPNILISTFRGVFHFFKGAGVAVGGEFRHLWNRTWHGLMTALLRHAEVPTRAEGFFWSTSGPGMKNPFVLVDADTAILTLLAFLSQQELTAARKEMYSDLNEPRRILEERVQDDSSYSMRLNEIRLVSNSLARTEQEHRDNLNGFWRLDETERQYRELLSGFQGNSQIRMTAEELESFTTRGTPLVKKFYIERYFPRLTSSDIVKFWESRDLTPGDWQGLTDQIMSSIFTPEIIVPFEAASDDLVIDSNQDSGLERIIQEALEEQGIVTGESTEYHIGHPIRTKNIPRSPDYQDLPIQFPPQPVGS